MKCNELRYFTLLQPVMVTIARNRLMSLEVDGGREGWCNVEISSRIWVKKRLMRVTGVRHRPGMAGQGRAVEVKPRAGWNTSMQAGRVSGGRAVVELSVLSILWQLRGNLLGTNEKERTVIRKHRKLSLNGCQHWRRRDIPLGCQ